MRTWLFALSMMVGVMLPKGDAAEQPAFEVTCPDFTVLVSPADGHVNLQRATSLADCLGDQRSEVCTLQVVRFRRNSK